MLLLLLSAPLISLERAGMAAACEYPAARVAAGRQERCSAAAEMRREILEMFSLEGLGEKMIQSG